MFLERDIYGYDHRRPVPLIAIDPDVPIDLDSVLIDPFPSSVIDEKQLRLFFIATIWVSDHLNNIGRAIKIYETLNIANNKLSR